MTTVDLGAVVAGLLSAGGLVTIGGITKVIRDVRGGVRAGQREVVRDLMEWRDDLDSQLRAAATDRDFWRDLAAERGAQLRDVNILPAVPNPVPPSRQEPTPTRQRRGRRRDVEGKTS